MKIEKLRKLLFMLCLDGSCTVCSTCIHAKEGNYCKYDNIDGTCECDDYLSHYEPNEELLK